MVAPAPPPDHFRGVFGVRVSSADFGRRFAGEEAVLVGVGHDGGFVAEFEESRISHFLELFTADSALGVQVPGIECRGHVRRTDMSVLVDVEGEPQLGKGAEKRVIIGLIRVGIRGRAVGLWAGVVTDRSCIFTEKSTELIVGGIAHSLVNQVRVEELLLRNDFVLILIKHGEERIAFMHTREELHAVVLLEIVALHILPDHPGHMLNLLFSPCLRLHIFIKTSCSLIPHSLLLRLRLCHLPPLHVLIDRHFPHLSHFGLSLVTLRLQLLGVLSSASPAATAASFSFIFTAPITTISSLFGASFNFILPHIGALLRPIHATHNILGELLLCGDGLISRLFPDFVGGQVFSTYHLVVLGLEAGK